MSYLCKDRNRKQESQSGRQSAREWVQRVQSAVAFWITLTNNTNLNLPLCAEFPLPGDDLMYWHSKLNEVFHRLPPLWALYTTTTGCRDGPACSCFMTTVTDTWSIVMYWMSAWPFFFTSPILSHKLSRFNSSLLVKRSVIQTTTQSVFSTQTTAPQHMHPSVHPSICPVKQSFVSTWEANRSDRLLTRRGLLTSSSSLHWEHTLTHTKQWVSQWPQ